ncbi:helix-turn-helix domain-containing protein [Leptolyngbya sp. FACHB-261]|uniref:helix-turn-helix domain-containing protein n=1 Tax=Leptolyngbya sp. FACHB-261 TaxID=2692806 RepID=UPI0018EF67F1|nr:helix-turn-helix domain-containing protein [Leptolyngbya sp. FACHB-261]
MAGVYKLEIQESEDELKQLLRKQKTASNKERIHLLYLLKSKRAKTVQEAASILGRHRATVQEWLKHHREEGIEELLKSRPRSGRPRAIPPWAVAALQRRLEEPQGFDRHQATCDWLESQLGIAAEYKTVYQLVIIACKLPPRCHAL